MNLNWWRRSQLNVNVKSCKHLLETYHLQEKFKISSVFSTGLAEFDQNVIFIPFDNANSLFELSDMDIRFRNFFKKTQTKLKI